MTINFQTPVLNFALFIEDIERVAKAAIDAHKKVK